MMRILERWRNVTAKDVTAEGEREREKEGN
jgi:hypothetical protein